MTVLIFLVVGVPLVGLMILAGIALMGLRTVAAAQNDLPSLADQGEINLAQTSEIYANDGTVLAYLHGVENRTIIGSGDIPNNLRYAVVAVEDARFYQHSGVDFEGVLRAFAADVNNKNASQGSSTITMQLVGNLYLDRKEKTLTRKIDEMALAWQFEKKYSKSEILDMYLNTVYFGSGAYGIQAASLSYFDKSPSELTLAEAALLAGVVQQPYANSPRVDLKQSTARRNIVLQKMYQQNYITAAQFAQAEAEPVKLTTKSVYAQNQDPYVVAYVQSQLTQIFGGSDRVFKGGLRVYTTIIPAYQRQATKSIKTVLDRKTDPAAALVSIEPSTGYIRAMVSSSDFSTTKFNYATQGKRQPGSAFKTFALTAAVEAGINPWTTVYVSKPLHLPLKGSTKFWDVTTYSHTYLGPVTLARATLSSDNTVYAQLAMDVGADKIANVAKRMGITSPINEDPAIALGGLKVGVSALEMASAYATLANNGQHVEPTIITKVTDANGKVLWQASPKKTQAISAGVAYEVTKILQQNIQSGTGTAANIGRPAAGKTGTAQDYSDAWFCGYTPHLSTAIWMGYPDTNKHAMTDVHGIKVAGGTFPAQIWARFMSPIDRNYPLVQFAVPAVDAIWTPFKSQFAGSIVTTTSNSTTTTVPGASTTTSIMKPTTTTTKKPTTTTTKKPATTTTKAATTT
jgi:penicillin-binding protein 1A